jgi:HD superfamily phosphohydrolase YqeK
MVELLPQNSTFWLARAREHKQEMLFSGKAGLFQWTITHDGTPERFRNVVEHELMVAEIVDVLGELTGCSNVQRAMLRQAAMVHDIWKRRHIESIAKASNEEKEAVQNRAFANQEQFLRTNCIPEGVIRLTQSVGHTSLLTFIQDPTVSPFQLKESVTLPMMIMYCADLITSGNNITGIDERIAALNNRQSPYPERYKGGEIFAGRTYYEAAQELGYSIEERLASTIVKRNPDLLMVQNISLELPNLIQTVIGERIVESK